MAQGDGTTDGGAGVERQTLAGYLGIRCEKVPDDFNAGFSVYVAAWPLVGEYPGNKFQTGLFGTWMHPQYDTPPATDRKLYCDIEGGLGWWRDTRFATTTPKFIMGGVALNFSAWANGPGAGKNRDWNKPVGLYGVAQLSANVIWPPDGLNLRQGTCGQLWGYGYHPLPLIEARATTSGKAVRSGGHCWTLFLNTGNFKGPVAFFTPYFFSSITAEEPELEGLFLDSRPAEPNRPHQMETQYIPAAVASSSDGQRWARIAPTRFPRNDRGESIVMHNIRAYRRAALCERVAAWLGGRGGPVSGAIDSAQSMIHTISGEMRASWAIYTEGTERDARTLLDWKLIATGTMFDEHTFGYRWNVDLCSDAGAGPGVKMVTLPEYYRLSRMDDGSEKWVAVHGHDVPEETGLGKVSFAPARGEAMGAYVTPVDRESCWKKPGPVSGPSRAKLGDGSTVEYYWYRFADQPAMLKADLTDAQREAVQKRVEKLHKHWKMDGEYLPPPGMGELAEIDPALVVKPPRGLEVGYVPIVTWQGVE